MNITGTVAITGAGAGLGQSLAVAAAERGYSVLAMIYSEAQRPELEAALEGLPGKVEVDVVDVTKPGDFAFPEDTDVLINNAGIRFKNLPIEVIPTEEFRTYMEVNFLGAVELTRRVIPVMRARGRGTILNMNSGSLAKPFPFLAPYRATKGALAAFSESLRIEMAPFGIRILEFLPGAMATGLSSSSITTGRAEAADVPGYELLADALANALIGTDKTTIVPAIDAARFMIDTIESGDRFRYGTGETSNASLENWRPGGGEPVVDGFIRALGLTPGS